MICPGIRCLLVIVLMTSFVSATQSAEWIFDAALLGNNVSAETVEMFNAGMQMPGIYHVGIYLNDEKIGEEDVRFLQDKSAGGAGLTPCLTPTSVASWGIKVPRKIINSSSSRNSCFQLSSIAHAANVEFDFARQRLLLSIPQALLEERGTRQISSALWNDGIPAFLMGYQADVSGVMPRERATSKQLTRFVRLTPGFNIGSWRLRNATSWQKNHGRPGQWQTAYTRLERGLYDLKSRLTVGESSTPSDVFESVPFRGVMLGTDDAMFTPGDSVFTPIIRGIAETQARVVVRYNGDILFTRSVPPGPFTLDNVPVPVSGGELDVSVEESNGNIQHFAVPWQTPAVALHEGYNRYSLMVGRYWMDGQSNIPVGQFTIMSGLPYSITLYGGIQQADDFRSVAAGIGFSLGAAGSISSDITKAAETNDGVRGKAIRIRYNKSMGATNTQLSLELSRYSDGYRSFSESVNEKNKNDNQTKGRESATLSLSQPLGRVGILSLSTSQYRSSIGVNKSSNTVINYSVPLSGMTLSLNGTKNEVYRNSRWKTERKLSLGLSIPLVQGPGATANAQFQINRSHDQGDAGQATFSGQNADGRLSWSATTNVTHPQASQPDSRASTITAGWKSAYGKINGHYGQSSWSRQMGIGVSGGAVLSQEGIAVGQSTDGTIAVIDTSRVSDISITGRPGLRTNGLGLALTTVTPYRKNRVSLDPLSVPQNAELVQSEVTVVPTQGAVLPAVFIVRTGERGLIRFKRPSGETVPFGAIVTQKGRDGESAGIVGENGEAYLTGLNNKDTLTVRWGRSQGQQCSAPLYLSEGNEVSGIYHLDVECL